jgi:hypothetical protein
MDAFGVLRELDAGMQVASPEAMEKEVFFHESRERSVLPMPMSND